MGAASLSAGRVPAVLPLLLAAAAFVAACAPGDPTSDEDPPEAAHGLAYGEACLEEDCGDGLECVTAFDGLPGEIPGGACLARCDADEACPEDTVCIGGVCLSECYPGVSSDSSCPSRDDVACAPTDALATTYACMPVCSSDADCSDGLHCQPQTGLCDTPVPEGAPTGASCEPGSSTCAGACLDAFGAGIGVCTQPCSFGAPDACPGGECLVMTPGPTEGDLGLCTVPCVRHEDCPDPSQSCFAGGCFAAAPCDADGACGMFLGAQLECVSPEGTEASFCLASSN